MFRNQKKLITFCCLLSLLLPLGCTFQPHPARLPLSSFFNKAAPLLAAQRYSETIATLERAATIHPDQPDPLLTIGQIYLAQHRWLMAEDAFNRALARDLENVRAMTGLAESLLNQQRLDKALELWQQAATFDPDLPHVFGGQGRTYLARQEIEAAKESFLRQQEHTPDPTANWYLAILTAPTDLEAALNYLEQIPDDTPPTSKNLLAQRDYLLAVLEPFTPDSPQEEIAKAVGIAIAQLEEWSLAQYALETIDQPDVETLSFLAHISAELDQAEPKLFEQAQKMDPTSALPLYFEGIYLRNQNKLKAAQERFEQAIELDPENIAIYLELAQTQEEQGNLLVAEGWYLQAIEISETNPQIQLLILDFYARHSYQIVETGIPLAQTMLEEDDDNAEIYHLLGWMLFLAGEPDTAETTLRQALTLDPASVRTHYHLGRVLETQGQTVLARIEYQKVVDWDVSGLYRDQALKGLQRLGNPE